MAKTRLEQIILATLKLASVKGLGNVSLQMIADEVGIRKASLFNHISSKDDLLGKMYIYLREKAKEHLAPSPIEIDGDPYDILLSAFYNYLKICRDPNLNMFYKLIYSERAFNDEARRLVEEETDKMVKATTSLFRELSERGALKLVDIELEAVGFAFAIHNFIDLYIDANYLDITPAYKVEDYIKNFLRGKTYEE